MQVETEVDLQLLQTRCVVIQLVMNRSKDECLPYQLRWQFCQRNVVQFSKDSSVMEHLWLVAGNLHFNKGFQHGRQKDFFQGSH